MPMEDDRTPARRLRRMVLRRHYETAKRIAAGLILCSVLFFSGYYFGSRQKPTSTPAESEPGNTTTVIMQGNPASSPDSGSTQTSVWTTPADSPDSSGVSDAPGPSTVEAAPAVAQGPSVQDVLATIKWPVQGRIVREPSWRLSPSGDEWTYFSGVDIQAESGAEVAAVLPGKVESVSVDPILGNTVVISHDAGITSSYGRLSSLAVNAGDEVAQGDILGTVGSEALYFKLAAGDEAVNVQECLAKAR